MHLRQAAHSTSKPLCFNVHNLSMKRIGIVVVIGVLVSTIVGGGMTDHSPTAGPVILIEDVDRFYKVYDSAGGHPTAEQLQRDYIDSGSDGLHQFAKMRNITGSRIAETLTKRPQIYADAKHCTAVLPHVRERLQEVFG